MPDSDWDWDLISSYVGLVSLASFSIYCGAFDSLPAAPRNQAARKKSLLQHEEGGEDEDVLGRLSSNEAWLFPIVGSVVLFGMYVAVTYAGEDWVNLLLGWYFSIVGVGSVWKTIVTSAKFMIGQERWNAFDRHRLLLLRGPLEVISLSCRTPTLVLLPVAILPSILYSFSGGSRKPVLWAGVLALSFVHSALSVLRLDSFRTGCILLSGLFLYDVYWVFGTDVMVKVATSLDAPIKLLWPKSMTLATERGFTMLGLGDVVIPGIFVALALRYDHARAENTGRAFKKPYFSVTLTAYIVGLVATMTVMHVSGMAQPALLYLSPACMLSLVGTAVMRGELEDVWRWSDDHELSAKTAQEASVTNRDLPEAENGRRAPQPRDGADGSDHVDAEVMEHDEEGEEVRVKKRKSRGKKKA